MRIVRSLRVSSQDANGNWKTEEAEVELSAPDIGIVKMKEHRKVAQVLDYECELILCKSIKDQSFSEYIKEKVSSLAARKAEIDGLKAEIGIGTGKPE